MSALLLHCIVLLFGATALADDFFPAARPHLQDLKKGKKLAQWDGYIPHFLIVQTAKKSEKTAPKLVGDLKQYLLKAQTAFRGQFGKSGSSVATITKTNWPLPKETIKGDQLKGIKKCKRKYCKMKLNTDLEKTVMERTPEDKKKSQYHDLVLARVRRFLKERVMWGYEERADNVRIFRRMVELLSFLAKDYPSCGGYFQGAFWEKKKSACVPKDSFLRQEVVELNINPIQPILRISEVFQVEEGGRTLFFEPHIYTNHYFDISARLYEVFPLGGGGQTLVITDFMEIDQLKKSGFIRTFYKNKMIRAIRKAQKKELAELS